MQIVESFSHSSAPFGGAQRVSRTSGVFPIASRIEDNASMVAERTRLRRHVRGDMTARATARS
jgi:hypothetical protein